MTKTINPDMVILARESRGMTQKELANELAVTQGRISKIEGGLLTNIPDDLLKTLSGILNYPEEFFFSKEEIYGLGMHLIYHRKRKSLTSKTLNKLQAQINITRMHLSRLLRAIDLKDSKMFELDIDEHEGDIEKIAQAVRGAWLLPSGPVKNLTNAIENAGGIIIWCNFETPLLDAISQWIPGLPPLVFANYNVPGDRLRFSLAHELGHIIMHRIPNPEMEKQADRFAGEFLMPKNNIAPSLNYLNLEKLGNLKLQWKVSMASLITRAKELNKITDRQARYLWIQMSGAHYRTREPIDIEKEKPSIFQQIYDVYRSKLQYSLEEICQLLTIYPQEFSSKYFFDTKTPQLFAIK